MLFLAFAPTSRAQDSIVVTSSEDFYLHDAIYTMTIDGVSVTPGTTCTARNPSLWSLTGTPQVNTFTGNWGGAAAVHTIVITLTNMASAGNQGQNLNLWPWSITFDGVAATHFSGNMLNGKPAIVSGSPPFTQTYKTIASSVLPPVITTQPAAQTALNGTAATFTIVATNSPTYQWMKNGTAIPGATSAMYTTPQTASKDSGSLFSVVVTNAAGSVTSATALLTVRTTASLDGGASTFSTTLAGYDSLVNCSAVACTSALGTNAVGAPMVALNVTTTVTHTVALTWSASSSATVASYNVKRSQISGSGYSTIGSTSASILKYTDGTVVSGQTYYYVVTAVGPACPATPVCGESPNSNQVPAVIPTP